MALMRSISAVAAVLLTIGQMYPESSQARFDAAALVLVAGKPAADVVVWLEAPRERRDTQNAVLDQRNLTFSPVVLVTTVGSTVEFPNNDRVLHNVFSFHDGQRFDLGLYPVGKTKLITFERAGVSRLFCNIHTAMAAYVVVVDSPYFGVTDEAGQLTFSAVPPGAYRYHAWRAGSDEISDTVTIDPNAVEIQWPAG